MEIFVPTENRAENVCRKYMMRGLFNYTLNLVLIGLINHGGYN
jgi:hypothetical protein